jgi:hypothetical protein
MSQGGDARWRVSPNAPLYEINDGVRRAKAADLAGRDSVPATVDGHGPVRHVPVVDLRVPKGNTGKHRIDITTETAEERWLDTYVRTASGETPPPIDVRTAPNSDGVPIRSVPVVKKGRAVDPFSGE